MRLDGTDENMLEGDVNECPGSCLIIHYAHPNKTERFSGHPLQYVIRECSNIEHTNGTGWTFCTSWQDVHGEDDLTLNNNAPPPEELMIDYDEV